MIKTQTWVAQMAEAFGQDVWNTLVFLDHDVAAREHRVYTAARLAGHFGRLALLSAEDAPLDDSGDK